MRTVSLEDATEAFSNLVEEALKGEFVTITRRGKPVAALVSIGAADIARWAPEKRSGLVSYVRTGPDVDFERDTTPSRTVDL